MAKHTKELKGKSSKVAAGKLGAVGNKGLPGQI